MEEVKVYKQKVRLQRIHKAASPLKLEYYYRDNGLFVCKDAQMNNVTHDEFVKGKPYKTIFFSEKEFFKDIEIGYEEKAFLTRHSFVKFDGNPNMNNCTVEMIDIQEKTNSSVIELKRNNEVFNIINALDTKQINNLCHYLGQNVSKKDMNDVFLMLLNTNDGIAYANYDKVKLYSKDADAMMKVILNKALILGVVESRNDGFYFGNKIVAASIDELYYFCKNNEEVYNVGIAKVVSERDSELLPTIQYMENFIVATEAQETKIKEKEFATEYTDDDRAWAVAKLSEYKIKGYSNPQVKIETIITKLIETPQIKREWEERKEFEKRSKKG